MAYVVLAAVVGTVLNQLAPVALDEALLLTNSRSELQRLKLTVGAIRQCLQDAEERQSRDNLVQDWLLRLMAAMYDADDLLDAVVARALQKQVMSGNAFTKEVRIFFSKSNQMAAVCRTAHRVKDIRESLDDIATDMGQFKFLQRRLVDQRPVLLYGERTHSLVPQNEVFGRETETNDIINMLLLKIGDPKSIAVIAITGFGGLGKTTLAKLVYNDERVRREFDMRLWVCVNHFSNLKQVVMAIIDSSGESPASALSLDQLQRQLRGIIGGQKLLLVIDNVWDEDASNWLMLKPLLDCAQCGSKVLVTTRSRVVASCLNAFEPYYELKALSEERAWDLFAKRAFKEGELAEDSELEALGRKIAQKCGCVPLALVTIGSLVRVKGKEKKTLLPFLEKQLSEVVSIDENLVMQALKISYNDLHWNLKHCFAYCSIFPKDYLFEKEELVRLWFAQDFLEPKNSFREVGTEFFVYLVERCFFQEVQLDDKHGFVTYFCKMHDLLHDLAKQVGSVAYAFIETVDDALEGKTTHRHITFDCELDPSVEYRRLFSESDVLRTLRFFPGAIRRTSLRPILARFKMLRTLDLSSTELVKVSDSIGELIHMRYLNLSGNEDLKLLPKSISKLPHLQTLNLSWCTSLEKLPSSIRKLTRLSYLMLNGCRNLTFLPRGISALTSLVYLDRLIVHQVDGGLRYLDCLDNLYGNLTVELPRKGWLKAVEDAEKSNMSKKHKLNGLIIEWKKSDESIDGDQRLSKGEVEQVLEALNPHECLQYLRITECDAGKLPTWVSSHRNIKELNLQCWHEMEYMEDGIASSPFCPSIETLTMEDMPNVKGWWREVSPMADDDDQISTVVPCFPRVSKVDIRRCPNLIHRMPVFGQLAELTLASVDCKTVTNLLKDLTRLKKLKLEQIKGLEYLLDVWIGQLTALETLEVASCNKLKGVSRCGLAKLTVLEELKFEECGRVDLIDEYGEMEEEEEDDNQQGLPWGALQRLRILELSIRDEDFNKGLRYLTALEDLAIHRWQPGEVEDKHYKGLQYLIACQELANQGLQQLQEEREEEEEEEEEEEVEEEEEESPWKGLTRLRKLTVGFRQVATRFPKEIQCLSCLQHLVISDCRELRGAWTALANMKLLESLEFRRVENVIQEDVSMGDQFSITSLKFDECHGELEWVDQMQWELFPSLHSLSFVSMPDLECLPKGIQCVPSLQQLVIFSCQYMTSLPNWMTNLTSVKSLVVAICSDELRARCVEETGADWPHFRHIPYICIG